MAWLAGRVLWKRKPPSGLGLRILAKKCKRARLEKHVSYGALALEKPYTVSLRFRAYVGCGVAYAVR